MRKRKFADGGIYTAEMGQPPQDIDGASAFPRKRKSMVRKPVIPKPRPLRGVPAAPMDEPTMPAAPPAPPAPAGVPGMKSGGSVGSASRRADGIARQGKTKGRMC